MNHHLLTLFSFKLDQSHVAQGGLELTEICLPVFPVLGLKVYATTAWPLWLTSGLALHSDLQANFISQKIYYEAII